jgi:protein gp37
MSQPYRWNRIAQEGRDRARVFCGSLMDFFEDRDDLLGVRELTLMIAYQTNWLDWLFLTKRPQNIRPLLKLARHGHHPNENWLSLQERATRYGWWFGATVENRLRARERIDILRDVPAKVRFLSVEPMLEPFDLSPWLAKGGIHWVICGGESGPRARNFDLSWMEEVVGACRAYKVPVFCKQTGSNARAEGISLKLIDRKGEDVTGWPEPPWGGEWPREIPAVSV